MKAPAPEGVCPDVEVGGYRVERPLGAGGFGQVFLAWRDGVPYALKFLLLEAVGDWGWRELLLLMRHDFPQVVKLESHFKWTGARSTYLVLVMEYVPGPTLFDWAQAHNPSAREVLAVLLPLARALRQVHAVGVLHRDLKGDNILLREADGLPVLVDFGAGTLPNAPPATRGAFAPGTPLYRSPEAVHFLLRTDRAPGERYVYAVKDELYALGVLLYFLLTDVYPYEGPEQDLLADILAGEAPSPREENSRVPEALSDLCMRLLAREPVDRMPSAGSLCEALEALAEQSRGDTQWDVPLCYGWTADGRTTEDAPERVGPNPQAWLERWVRQKPRRGRPPRRPTTRRKTAWALLAVGAGLVLAPGRPSVPVAPEVPDERGRAFSGLEEWSSSELTSWEASVHEVAPPREPLEADASAAPLMANTPASATPVTLSSKTTRMKQKGNGSAGSNVLLAVAAASHMACPAAPVRQEPKIRECPVGAIETMKGPLGLRIGELHGADMPGAGVGNELVPAQEGPVTLMLIGHWKAGADPMGRGGTVVLPHRTLFSGQLYVGDKLVHGRFTQALTPEGKTFPVCLELWDLKGHRGVEIEPDKGPTWVFPRVEVKTVDHFE